MDRKKAGMEIMELFIRAVRKYNSLEKAPHRTKSKQALYHSERHMLDRIGEKPGMNITDFARELGVTKGAVSQVVKKLETKGVIRRCKSEDNAKEVFLELTEAGRAVYLAHKETNEETIKPLVTELSKYPDDKVRFLISMFRWIDGFLDQGGREMKGVK